MHLCILDWQLETETVNSIIITDLMAFKPFIVKNIIFLSLLLF